MKMDKNTKILLGVGAVAVIGYFIYKNNNTPKANAIGKTTKGGMMSTQNVDMGYFRDNCGCSYGSPNILTRADGTVITEYECGNGEHSNSNKDRKCCGGGTFPNCDGKKK